MHRLYHCMAGCSTTAGACLFDAEALGKSDKHCIALEVAVEGEAPAPAPAPVTKVSDVQSASRQEVHDGSSVSDPPSLKPVKRILHRHHLSIVPMHEREELSRTSDEDSTVRNCGLGYYQTHTTSMNQERELCACLNSHREMLDTREEDRRSGGGRNALSSV